MPRQLDATQTKKKTEPETMVSACAIQHMRSAHPSCPIILCLVAGPVQAPNNTKTMRPTGISHQASPHRIHNPYSDAMFQHHCLKIVDTEPKNFFTLRYINAAVPATVKT